MAKIDLHIHSCHSDDGELDIVTILENSKRNGAECIAITDHNSVDGVAEAIKYGKGIGVNVLSGIEIDCTWKHLDLHILGYGIDYTDPAYERLGNDIRQQEKALASRKLDLIEAHTGLSINRKLISEKAPNGVVTGELIGEVAMADQNNHSNPFLKPYLEGGERSDRPYVNFYWDFFSQGNPAYTEVTFISLKEAIDLIESTGGVPVLAHPGMNLKQNREQVYDLIDAGIKGIEVYSSYHSEEDIAFFSKVVSDNKLLMTCGSDFHGKNKPDIVIAEFGRELEYGKMITALKQAIAH